VRVVKQRPPYTAFGRSAYAESARSGRWGSPQEICRSVRISPEMSGERDCSSASPRVGSSRQCMNQPVGEAVDTQRGDLAARCEVVADAVRDADEAAGGRYASELGGVAAYEVGFEGGAVAFYTCRPGSPRSLTTRGTPARSNSRCSVRLSTA